MKITDLTQDMLDELLDEMGFLAKWNKETIARLDTMEMELETMKNGISDLIEIFSEKVLEDE